MVGWQKHRHTWEHIETQWFTDNTLTHTHTHAHAHWQSIFLKNWHIWFITTYRHMHTTILCSFTKNVAVFRMSHSIQRAFPSPCVKQQPSEAKTMATASAALSMGSRPHDITLKEKICRQKLTNTNVSPLTHTYTNSRCVQDYGFTTLLDRS